MPEDPADYSADTWEHFIVFPAHIVVHAPRALRLLVHAFGANRYWKLRARVADTAVLPRDERLREELEALFTELCQVRDVAMGHPSFKDAARLLVDMLFRFGGRFRQAVGSLPRAFNREGLPFDVRPFLRTRLLLDDVVVLEAEGRLLRTLLLHEPSQPELASALVFDLRFVREVLREEILVQDGNEALRSLARDLSGALDQPMNELIRAGELEWV